MTLCAAWIRHGPGDEGEELVFVTDSYLSGGESWDTGLKLFDLGRSDCLLCFAGSTLRAYPQILQGLNSSRSDVNWNDPRFDLFDILESLCKLFTKICLLIDLSGRTGGNDPEAIHEARSEAEFLFGGWSWRSQKFCIWRVFYSRETASFIHEAIHETADPYIFTFLSLDEDRATNNQLSDTATEKLRQLLFSRPRFSSPMDMEPLSILIDMARDQNHYTVKGPLQIAKVYRSGHNEFFGIIWNGKATFMGREVNIYDLPPVRFFDPENTRLIDALPIDFYDIADFDFGEESTFVQRAYSDGKLRDDLPEAYRIRLARIFRDIAYQHFVTDRETALKDQRSQANTAEALESFGSEGEQNHV